MLSYKRLDWDSEFWERDIYSADVSSIHEVRDIIQDLKFRENIFSCYFFSQEKLPDPGEDLHLYDEKVTFKKYIDATIAVANHSADIKLFEGIASADFIRLAQSSGEYSRFKKDPRLAPKFAELYRLWLLNSLNGNIADKVLVNDPNSVIEGFITLKFHPLYGQIGIIAVDEKYQGKSIGSKLIREVERLTLDTGRNILKVVTQSANTNAMNFYKKNGFTIEHTEFIYHYHNG